jgi:hypothetical protein
MADTRIILSGLWVAVMLTYLLGDVMRILIRRTLLILRALCDAMHRHATQSQPPSARDRFTPAGFAMTGDAPHPCPPVLNAPEFAYSHFHIRNLQLIP